jgi:hypothetical protein
VTGAGFRPGVSGNPGGRPKGLGRLVRETVGEDGDVIVQFMTAVMTDRSQRTRDRLDAAKWLADRGFGRAGQVETQLLPSKLDLSKLTDEELETMIVLFEKAEARDA